MTTIDYSADIAGQTTNETAVRPARSRVLGTIGTWFLRWRQRSAERRMLYELSHWDPRLLKDIGITPYDVRAALHDRNRPLERRD